MTTKEMIKGDIKKWTIIKDRLKSDKIYLDDDWSLLWKADDTKVPCRSDDCNLCTAFYAAGIGRCFRCPLYHTQQCECGASEAPWMIFSIQQDIESAESMIKMLVKTLKELTP